MGRIVLFGATGYTGSLTAHALVQQLGGSAPATPADAGSPAPTLVLAGRNRDRLEALRDRLPRAGKAHVELAEADVAQPATVSRLLTEPDDVLISCVGPFNKWGRPAVEAAIKAGATYLDSTGEPEFLLRLFEDDDVRAAATGARLVPAFGYDYVPGNLAGALALRAARAAGRPAVTVDVGYFSPGAPGVSGGTAASGAGILLGRSPSFRHGRLGLEYPGRRTHRFEALGRQRRGLSVGGTEHFDLPRNYPELQTVGVYLGQLGAATKPVQVAAVAAHTALRLPLVRRGVAAITDRAIVGSKGGPESMAGASIAVAEARGEDGQIVARCMVRGPSPYDLTARQLAWAATNASLIKRVGTLGPVSAFGLEGLTAGCASIGLVAE